MLPRVARECYKWLLSPVQHSAIERDATVEAFPLNTGSSALGSEVERVCVDNELVIGAWSPIHLRAKLKELYWKTDKPAIGAFAFWEDTTRYLYLPRLRDQSVLEQAIIKGATSSDFFAPPTASMKVYSMASSLEIPIYSWMIRSCSSSQMRRSSTKQHML